MKKLYFEISRRSDGSVVIKHNDEELILSDLDQSCTIFDEITEKAPLALEGEVPVVEIFFRGIPRNPGITCLMVNSVKEVVDLNKDLDGLAGIERITRINGSVTDIVQLEPFVMANLSAWEDNEEVHINVPILTNVGTQPQDPLLFDFDQKPSD